MINNKKTKVLITTMLTTLLIAFTLVFTPKVFAAETDWTNINDGYLYYNFGGEALSSDGTFQFQTNKEFEINGTNLEYKADYTNGWIKTNNSTLKIKLALSTVTIYAPNDDLTLTRELHEDQGGYVGIRMINNNPTPPEDGYRPAISGQERFVTDVDSPKDVAYFQAFLKASDETDGDITDRIVIKNDNYTTNKSVLGNHTLTFSVSDSAGNEATLQVVITVIDQAKPIITGNFDKVTISYTKVFDVEAFRKTLLVTDNYDTLTNVDIKIKSNGYTENQLNLGTFTVVFAAVDSSGNEALVEKQIEVIDDVAPVFAGPLSFTKPLSSTLTVAQIKAELSATDEKEGNKTKDIKILTDEYTGNANKPRKTPYVITFEVADSKGNKATHEVSILVIDDIAPIYYIRDGVSFVLSPEVKLTEEQIIKLLVASGQITASTQTTVTLPVAAYFGNEEVPGTYSMRAMARSVNGNEYIHNFSITVLAEDDGGVVIGPDFDFGKFVKENAVVIIGIAIVLVVVGGYIIIKKKRN